MYCPNCGNICTKINDNGTKREGCSKCNYIHYKNPYPCISVLIINENDEVLLGKRHKNSIYPEKWCLPCGYMEYDETYVEAAVRGVKEEVGISILPKGIVNVVSNKLENDIKSLVVVLFAEYNGEEELIPGDDITEASFFDIYKLPPLAFEADNFIINEYRRNNKLSIIELNGSSF